MELTEHPELSASREGLFPPEGEEPTSLLPCCEKTIKMHAAFNPMMVCGECKQIIKCFHDEQAFKNYQKFCASRHRKILAIQHGGSMVVVYRAYQTYSS